MFCLADLLQLPLLQSARPQVLAGERFEDRPVRWVHTSEIFDISPLLKGGEVLFTTGLGLVGAPDGAIDDYIASLASQNVTALIMEVGRTFVHLPQEFVSSARAHQLPLITLHRVIPFVEITETVHPLLVSREIEALRQRDQAFQLLTAGMLAGDDIGQIIALTRGMSGVPVGLYSSGGQLLAGDDVREQYGDVTELSVGQESWASLAVAAPQGDMAVDVARVGARVAALKLSQKITGSPSRALAVSDLLADVMRGGFLQSDEIEARAASLGFTVNPQRRLVALIVDLTRAARTGLGAVTTAARRKFGPNLVAEIDDRIVLAVQVRTEETLENQLHGLIEGIESELANAGHGQVVRVVAGPVVDSVADLAISAPRANQGATLARQLGFPARVVTDRDLGLYDILARVVPDSELEMFVEQQLGPLLQADARSGNRLVATLNAYLESGRSKSAAAKALNIGRQTMYQRLERISRLLGGIDLAAHDRLTSLDLAVTAWRMRTSGLTRHPDA